MSSPRPIPDHDNRSLEAWYGFFVGLALTLVLFAPTIVAMAKEWISDEDMGHGIFVPAVSIWILWQRRDEFRGFTPKATWWGLAIVLLGLAELTVGTLGVEFFLCRTALLVTLAGVVITTCGVAVLRAALFPFLLLFFMIRIPEILYNQITLPLQLLASQLAETFLGIIGIPVLREGNVLELANQKLSVVEACSGIRSLLSLTFLSLIFGYFFEPKSWLRVVLVILTIPIAIGTNATRVTITGILAATKPELASGFFHTFEGWIVFMLALAILFICRQVINHVHEAVQAAKR